MVNMLSFLLIPRKIQKSGPSIPQIKELMILSLNFLKKEKKIKNFGLIITVQILSCAKMMRLFLLAKTILRIKRPSSKLMSQNMKLLLMSIFLEVTLSFI